MKLMQFLMGLDDSYMQIRSFILYREVLPDVRSAYATISSEESHRVASGSIVGSSQRNQAYAFVSNVPNKNNFQRNNQMLNSGPRPNNLNNNRQCGGSVGHPNGSKAFISKIGNLKLSNDLILYDVLVIPEYCVTFISVHKLVKENKITIAFDESRCYFLNQDLNLRNVLGTDDQCEGLYYYNSQGGIPLKMWIEYIITATYLINRLPSSVLNEKSSYEMIYKKSPSLSHLRVFGCLCFVTIVNNNDKFGSRSEKYVMMGSSNFKKGYRLYSLDKHQFIFSRDVKFFETTFPFKDSVIEKNDTSDVFQDIIHIKFFDIEYLVIPYDERVYPHLNSDSKSQSDSSHSLVSDRDVNTTDFPSNSGNDADSSEDIFATQNVKVTTLEDNIFSEGNLDQNPSTSTQDTQTVRRSSRQSVFPKNYNDFVVESKVKYDLETYIVDLPKDRKAIGCKWIYKIKYRSSGEINIYKARLVAQGFDQKERIDYEEIFSLSDNGVFLAFLVYVDDIIITGNNISEIKNFKVYLKFKFMIKDLGKLKYFLGIEIIETNKDICLNQRKYVLDLLSEYDMLACKPAKTLPNISYVVHYLSQFMHSHLRSHLKTAFKILRYLKSYPGLGIHTVKDFGKNLFAYSDADWAKCVVSRKSVTGYCVFLNNSLVSWKSKKQNTLLKSSTEAEYRALALVTIEVN
ncbi:ribonuclease H-like domain-containing protein [Tanacetum coccineum]